MLEVEIGIKSLAPFGAAMMRPQKHHKTRIHRQQDFALNFTLLD
jgi:hypothetical protein